MSKPAVSLSYITHRAKVIGKILNLGRCDILALLRHAGYDVPDSALIEPADDDLDVPTSTILRVSFEIREEES